MVLRHRDMFNLRNMVCTWAALAVCLEFRARPKMERRGRRLEPGADATLYSQSRRSALTGRHLDSGSLQHQVGPVKMQGKLYLLLCTGVKLGLSLTD
jgi:hypothetical protein